MINEYSDKQHLKEMFESIKITKSNKTYGEPGQRDCHDPILMLYS